MPSMRKTLLVAALAAALPLPVLAEDGPGGQLPGDPAKAADPAPAEPKKDEPKKDDPAKAPAKDSAAKDAAAMKEPAKDAKPAADTPLRARAPRSKEDALRILDSVTLRSAPNALMLLK